jgi:tripeptidyl-peptidase-2
MFDKNLLLRSDAHHVDCPKNFKLMSQERAFQICIDPTKLQKGIAHYSEVQAFDSENDYLGPLFRVPITVIVPLEVPETVNFKISWNNLQMQPARPYRRFLRPPENSVFLHYRLKSNDKMRVTKYVISLLQVVPDTSFRLTGHDKVLTLEPEGEEQGYLKLYDGYTLEICITKAWMNVGDSNVCFGFNSRYIRKNVYYHIFYRLISRPHFMVFIQRTRSILSPSSPV